MEVADVSIPTEEGRPETGSKDTVNISILAAAASFDAPEVSIPIAARSLDRARERTDLPSIDRRSFPTQSPLYDQHIVVWWCEIGQVVGDGFYRFRQVCQFR